MSDHLWLSALFAKCLFAGLAVAAPMGPVGVLCLRRVLAHGWGAGLCTGLGAACADACYGLVVALGLSWLTDWLLGMGPRLRILASLCLLGVGAVLVLARPRPEAVRNGAKTWLGDFASAFGLTLTNPLAILALTALFPALGVSADLGRGRAAALSAATGVLLGSWAWFAALSAFAMRVRPNLNAQGMRWVNRVTGAVLGLLGLAMLLGLDLAP
ncbi:MAG: LysE family translocator [Thermodesulfobacteriota bacterium]